MSKIKGEPDWMLQKRLKSLEIFQRKPSRPGVSISPA
jgi:Fe-S cluster assembly scaffold protein SufB